MNRPDFTIIVVSLNTKHYLERCLSAIASAAKDVNIEVIVVDNGSSDGTQAMLAQQFPHVRVIQNHENVGFGRANNIGAQAGRGRTLLFLNSDCELAPDSLKMMTEALNQNASLGGLFCRLLNPDGSLQPSIHRSFPSPWSTVGDLLFLSSLRYAIYRRPALHPWLLRSTLRDHQHPHDVAWGGGACMLVRRAVFEAVGGFDERFFMYWEDVDLCKQIRKAGYQLRYLPNPHMLHHWGKSTSQVPATMLREAYRSRTHYFEKHFPGWGGAVSRWTTLGELIIRRSVFTLLAHIPSRYQQSCLDQAATSAACLKSISESSSLEIEPQSSVGTTAFHLLAALVIAFSLFRYFHDISKFLVESSFIDFAHYYFYATMVSLGLDPFDPQAVARMDDLLKIRRAGAAANYPPLFYVFMQPWVLLPFRQASVLWLVINQACLLAALTLCFRQSPAPDPMRAAAVLFIVLNYQPLIENIALGQVNVLLLFFVTLTWWSLRTGHPWIGAGAVAMTVHIKVQYGLLIPLLWWTGQGRVAICSLLLASLGLGVGLFLLGPGHYLQYLQYLLSIPDYITTWIANLSPRATLHRWLGTSSEGYLFAEGLWLAMDTGILFLFARVLPRSTTPGSPASDWSWGLGLTAVFLLSPMASEHHLVVLLLPLTLLLLAEPTASMKPSNLVLFVAAALLLGSRYSLEQYAAFHQGWLSLLSTGKVAGVVALSWLLIRYLRDSRRPTP